MKTERKTACARPSLGDSHPMPRQNSYPRHRDLTLILGITAVAVTSRCLADEYQTQPPSSAHDRFPQVSELTSRTGLPDPLVRLGTWVNIWRIDYLIERGYAAAFDERIALAIPHQAGRGGSAPSRTAVKPAEAAGRTGKGLCGVPAAGRQSGRRPERGAGPVDGAVVQPAGWPGRRPVLRSCGQARPIPISGRARLAAAAARNVEVRRK